MEPPARLPPTAASRNSARNLLQEVHGDGECCWVLQAAMVDSYGMVSTHGSRFPTEELLYTSGTDGTSPTTAAAEVASPPPPPAATICASRARPVG